MKNEAYGGEGNYKVHVSSVIDLGLMFNADSGGFSYKSWIFMYTYLLPKVGMYVFT